ncbi:TMEM175 family protein [Propionicimonas sp.]|uniref:TMEM175 family protein n=1 Tax=Propionicimonas sp. TaxID=1955623 RepID=UPI0039E690A3
MTTYSRYRRAIAEGGSVERMAFFSDAVFAIAMTLLIIEVRAPEAAPGELTDALLTLAPEYLTFALSFAVVSLVWLAHVRKVSTLVGYDQNLLRLNLLMLLFVASIPLPTAILGRYGDETPAVVLYAVAVAATGLALAALWIYAWRRGFVRDDITVQVFRYVLVQSFPVPGVFLLSIPVALLAGPTAAKFSWIAALPVSLIITRLYRHRGPVAEQETQGS